MRPEETKMEKTRINRIEAVRRVHKMSKESRSISVLGNLAEEGIRMMQCHGRQLLCAPCVLTRKHCDIRLNSLCSWLLILGWCSKVVLSGESNSYRSDSRQ